MPLVTISLDYKTHAIWMRMPGNKSAWVRQMIALHAINDVQLIEHLGHPSEQWGCWPGDARCNPSLQRGLCVACWTPTEILEMGRFSTKVDYVLSRRMMPHPRPAREVLAEGLANKPPFKD